MLKYISKIIYISKHAKERFQQRQGILIANIRAKEIVEDILFERAEFIEDKKDETEEWIVEYENKKYRVLYSSRAKKIITVYPGVKKKRKKFPKKKKMKIKGNRQKIYSKKNTHYIRNKKIDYEEGMYEY